MRERLKNLLLVLLGLLMVVLLVINLALTLEIDSLLTIREELGLTGVHGSQSTAAAETTIRPAKVAIRGRSGLYLASGSQMEELLGSVSPILSEALGSVGKIAPIGKAQFLGALSDDNISFHFTHAVPFYLLQHWWTGETGFSSDQAAVMLAVVPYEEQVALVFADDEGRYFLAETAAGLERLVDLCAAAPVGNADYAFEQDGCHMLSLWEPVPQESVGMAGYAVTVPDFSAESGISETLLAAFDLNAFLAEVYKESNGDIVYVEGYRALRFSKDGLLVYSAPDGGIDLGMLPGLSEKESRAYAARRACAVLEQVCSAAGCRGGFSVADITEQAGEYVISCERMIGGAFVTEQDGYSAVVTVRDGRVTAIRIRLRSYTEAGSSVLLPWQLATALLDGEDNRLYVRYSEQEGMLVPRLYRLQGGMTDGME